MHKKIIPISISILFIGLTWQLIAIEISFPAILPPIDYLLRELGLILIKPDFIQNVGITILRGIIGFCFAFILSLSLSITAGFNHFFKSFMQPILVVLRSIPVISFVLLAILWFSPTQLPIFIALLTMFPILYQNILTGLEQTDKRLVEMASIFGKTPLNIFVRIYLPATKNGIFDGISTAMGFGWRAIIIGEVLAQPLYGIGTAMKNAQAYINVSELIAWTVIAILVSSLFELSIKIIRRIHFEKKFPTPKKYDLIKSQNSEIKAIEIVNLEKSFNERIIFNLYNEKFTADKIHCLKGASGKGKTTLMKLIAGIEKADAGKIKLPTNYKLAFAFQDLRLLPWLTVTENIAFGISSIHSKHECSDLISYLLGKLELTEHAHQFPHQLSGGQQQRVNIARALAAKSDILLLDEPLTGLDDALKLRIVEFLGEWIACYQPLVIWATHETIRIDTMEIVELDLEN